MGTVTKENDLDIETIMASRLTLAAEKHSGDPASQHLAGSSQQVRAAEEGKSGNDVSTPETDASPRALTGPGSGGQDVYQGSVAHISGGAVDSISKKTMDHGGSTATTNANLGSFSSSASEPNTLKTIAYMDAEKSRVPTKEQLKQFRAQCIVYLAFKRRLMPKKLHLDVALGNIDSKEDGNRGDLTDPKGKEQSVRDPICVPEVPTPLERPDSSEGRPSA